MEYAITHSLDRKCFETEVEGYPAILEYLSGNGFIDIVRTYVHPAIEGRGVASALVKSAYEYAEKNNLSVIPTCSYVGVWLKRHPEYQKQ